MHTHAGISLHNPVTLTFAFDLRVNACRGPAICVPSLVLIVYQHQTRYTYNDSYRAWTHAHTHTHTHTHTMSQMLLITIPTNRTPPVWVVQQQQQQQHKVGLLQQQLVGGLAQW